MLSHVIFLTQSGSTGTDIVPSSSIGGCFLDPFPQTLSGCSWAWEKDWQLVGMSWASAYSVPPAGMQGLSSSKTSEAVHNLVFCPVKHSIRCRKISASVSNKHSFLPVLIFHFTILVAIVGNTIYSQIITLVLITRHKTRKHCSL